MRPNFGLDIYYHDTKMLISKEDLHYTHENKTDLVFFIDEDSGCVVEFLINNHNVCDPQNNKIIYGIINI